MQLSAGAKGFVYTTRAFERIFKLDVLAGGALTRSRWGMPREALDAVLGWGRKPSAERAQKWAKALGLPLMRMEDGFLRSFGTGEDFRRCHWFLILRAFSTTAPKPVR